MAFGLYDIGTEFVCFPCYICADLGQPVSKVVTRTYSVLIQSNDTCANKVVKRYLASKCEVEAVRSMRGGRYN